MEWLFLIGGVIVGVLTVKAIEFYKVSVGYFNIIKTNAYDETENEIKIRIPQNQDFDRIRKIVLFRDSSLN